MKGSPPCTAAELRRFLEEKTGLAVTRLEMVKECSRPENFVVETADGARLLVKCVPPKEPGRTLFEKHSLPHFSELEGVHCAAKLRYGPWQFGECLVAALEWCAGGRVMPDALSPAEERDLVRSYGGLSAAMQRASAVLPARDSVAIRRETMPLLAGGACRPLRQFVERAIPESALSYDSSRLCVIHGDFHHGNIHFKDGCVTGIFDFESFRFGYAAEDWLRYVVCGAEHLHWFDVSGRRRLLALFSRLLPLARADEWRAAAGALLIRKIWRRFSLHKGPRAWFVLNMMFRLGFYRRILSMIDGAEKGGRK